MPFTWTESLGFISASPLTEIKANIDAVHNTIPVICSTNNTTVNATNNVSVYTNSITHSSYDGTDNTSENGTAGNNSSTCSTNDSSVNGTNEGYYWKFTTAA